MSVKLHDLVIKAKDGKIVIGEENKRGNLKSYIDISSPIIMAVVKSLMTKPKTYIHKETTINNEIKHFKITCVEMTPEEVKTMEYNDKRDASINEKNLSYLSGLLLNSLGANNIRFK